MIDASKISTDELLRELIRRFTGNLWADHRQLFEDLADQMRPFTTEDMDD